MSVRLPFQSRFLLPRQRLERLPQVQHLKKKKSLKNPSAQPGAGAYRFAFFSLYAFPFSFLEDPPTKATTPPSNGPSYSVSLRWRSGDVGISPEPKNRCAASQQRSKPLGFGSFFLMAEFVVGIGLPFLESNLVHLSNTQDCK